MNQDKSPEEMFFLILDSLYIKKEKRKDFIKENLNADVKQRCDYCYRVKKLKAHNDNNYCNGCLQTIRTDIKKASNI